ncbi:hypothetical protein ACHAW5_011349 [Stephanodiscus triporus]|uniref:THIF-type NAD/FAD binding fold domain-containing protein n=1 Tax=Stephanodiscus triporus TaxID=2934178 RepID=A0ABD3QQV4_9STRA
MTTMMEAAAIGDRHVEGEDTRVGARRDGGGAGPTSPSGRRRSRRPIGAGGIDDIPVRPHPFEIFDRIISRDIRASSSWATDSSRGQRRLLSTSVLVIGAGGIGSTVLLYLAAAGSGTSPRVDSRPRRGVQSASAGHPQGRRCIWGHRPRRGIEQGDLGQARDAEFESDHVLHRLGYRDKCRQRVGASVEARCRRRRER